MGVVVTSGIKKSGATIAGDTKRIVVVKTTAGYSSNPGHSGSGTIVATACK